MIEKLDKDIINAMKEKNKDKLSVLRMVKAGIKQDVIDKKKEANDDLLIDVVNRNIKMRKDSIVEFEKANRMDLVEKNKEEIDILMNYLPEQLSSDEVNKIIDEIFDIIKPTSNKDMGVVMKEATAKLKGRADMKIVSSIIKDKLNN